MAIDDLQGIDSFHEVRVSKEAKIPLDSQNPLNAGPQRFYIKSTICDGFLVAWIVCRLDKAILGDEESWGSHTFMYRSKG